MKKIVQIILALMVMALLASCAKVDKSNTLKDNTTQYNEWQVIEIDSCEYIYQSEVKKGYLAHKGNCKYCEKRRKESNK